ncbi:hypothetical protein L1987_66240 [Smallanthus sonchifolius]|uniref:Uncharacterized protein n=1 Tax=Smallanthus sonchifolius TaxID=185202 RepID=A0ACB9BWW7_9ASTR|nr:hypothetical protein L1987_66240 [Smallanthus sonchifolius]
MVEAPLGEEDNEERSRRGDRRPETNGVEGKPTPMSETTRVVGIVYPEALSKAFDDDVKNEIKLVLLKAYEYNFKTPLCHCLQRNPHRYRFPSSLQQRSNKASFINFLKVGTNIFQQFLNRKFEE